MSITITDAAPSSGIGTAVHKSKAHHHKAKPAPAIVGQGSPLVDPDTAVQDKGEPAPSPEPTYSVEVQPTHEPEYAPAPYGTYSAEEVAPSNCWTDLASNGLCPKPGPHTPEH